MKISISYPPFPSKKGIPLLTQNRQFQWFSNPTFIYPIIPAYAASLLKENGFEVFWDDGISDGLTYSDWIERLIKEMPDIVVFESKTPVIKLHWKIINELKKKIKNVKIILVGDHVTALPEESLNQSNVDYIITGGDYDFVLYELCRSMIDKNSKKPNGVWYRKNGKIMNTGFHDLKHDLNDLPFIDRDLTKWKNYAFKNGNFKYTPGTYIMAGRDCWWGKCSFCSWTTINPGSSYRTVSVDRHLDEIGLLIDKYKVKEIFDDSGCFPQGKWLEDFCKGIIKRGFNKKVTFGCNMRIGALSEKQWKLMKKANFRFILIGLESTNQNTLDKLNKGIKVNQIRSTIEECKKSGLSPHITIMVGYPWETKIEAEETIKVAKEMFVNGIIESLQATIVVPYPGTPLYKEAKDNKWLLTDRWEDFDMKKSVWKSPVSNEDIMKYTQDLYKAAITPKFILRKILTIRNIDDIVYLIKAASKVFAHITDFK